MTPSSTPRFASFSMARRMWPSGRFTALTAAITLSLLALPLLLPYSIALLVLGAIAGAGVLGLILVTTRLLSGRMRSAAALFAACVGGFLITSAGGEGISTLEVLYGGVFLLYLAGWIGSRLLVQPGAVFRDPADLLLLAFWVWTTLSCLWAPLFGAASAAVFSEWIAVTMFLFYFPARDLVERYPQGAKIVVTVLLFLSAGIALRNLIDYQAIVLRAAAKWQLGTARVTTNEVLLQAGSVLSLVLGIHQRSVRRRIGFLTLFLLLFLTLIMTQSRAYWLDFLVAAAVLFLLAERAPQVRYVLLVVMAALGATSAAFLLFPDVAYGIADVIVERFATLGTAVQSDISLRSRFYEAKAVLEKARLNPALGHGLAVPYYFYDIIDDVTLRRTFVHNGFVGLLYKGGFVGALLVLGAWGRALWLGWIAHRRTSGDTHSWALCGLLLLIAQIPSTSTAVGFYTDDRNLVLGLSLALCVGLGKRSRIGI